MSEMIERVARAIAGAMEQNGGAPYDLYIRNKHSKMILYDQARAAIEAMREPTEAMVESADRATLPHVGPDDCLDAHKAMIDEALK